MKKLLVLLVLCMFCMPTIASAYEDNSQIPSFSDIPSEVENTIKGIDINSISNEKFYDTVKNGLENQGFIVEELSNNNVRLYKRSVNTRAYTYKACKGKMKCDGTCNGRKCGIWKVQKIRTYYSLSDCKEVVKRARYAKQASNISSFLLGIGKKSVPASIIRTYGNTMGDYITFFNNAVSKGKGVSFDYEFCITTVNASSFARNSSYTYR